MANQHCLYLALKALSGHHESVCDLTALCTTTNASSFLVPHTNHCITNALASNLQNKNAFVTLAALELAAVLVAFQWNPDAMIAAACAGWRAYDRRRRAVFLGAAVIRGGV